MSEDQWVTVPPPVILRWLWPFQTLHFKKPLAAGSECVYFPQVESRPSVGFPIRLDILHLLLPQRKGHMSIPSILSDTDFHGITPFSSASSTASGKCWHTLLLMGATVYKHHLEPNSSSSYFIKNDPKQMCLGIIFRFQSIYTCIMRYFGNAAQVLNIFYYFIILFAWRFSCMSACVVCTFLVPMQSRRGCLIPWNWNY